MKKYAALPPNSRLACGRVGLVLGARSSSDPETCHDHFT
jgi:hypothetical protein